MKSSTSRKRNKVIQNTDLYDTVSQFLDTEDIKNAREVFNPASPDSAEDFEVCTSNDRRKYTEDMWIYYPELQCRGTSRGLKCERVGKYLQDGTEWGFANSMHDIDLTQLRHIPPLFCLQHRPQLPRPGARSPNTLVNNCEHLVSQVKRLERELKETETQLRSVRNQDSEIKSLKQELWETQQQVRDLKDSLFASRVNGRRLEQHNQELQDLIKVINGLDINR